MRVLLYRAGFLGDVVMTMPAVRLVRMYNPDAHIMYATLPPCDELLKYCPYVDEVRLAGAYHLREYDKVVHFRHEMHGKKPVYWGTLHMLDAHNAGLLPDPSRFSDLSELYKPVLWLEEDRPTYELPRQYIVIHAWSTNGRNWRLWPLEKWDELVLRLNSEIGVPVVQIGTERSPAVDGVAFDLRGKNTVMQDAWVVAQASCCIALDSFVAHVAHANKLLAKTGKVVRQSVPTVLLHGPVPWQCVVPDGVACVPVADYSDCGNGGPCYRSHGNVECQYGNACMRGLGVDRVLGAVDGII